MKHPGGPSIAEINSTSTGRGHGSLERITVNLVPKAAQAVEETIARTGDSKTDAINRAVQVYAFLEKILQDGGAVYVRETPDGDLGRLHIF